MTRILVLSEKHGDRYFDVTTDEQLHKVSLAILKERLEEGYWYVEPTEVKPLDYTKEDIANMPESMRAEATERLQRNDRLRRRYLDDKLEFEEIQKAVTENNGKLAYRILRGRGHYEYEGFHLETCEEV